MPAPKKSQLASTIKGMFQSAGLKGENIGDLADVVADALASALAKYVAMVKVQPGIAASVDPMTGSGASAGPGTLQGPKGDAYGLEPLIKGLLAGKGLRGEAAGDLAAAIAGTIAFGLEQFTSNVKVAPGIPVAGFATAGPGTLM